MPWRLVGRAVGVGLLVAAAVVVLVQVDIGSGAARRSCGSPLDVVAARTSWETWRARDLADPVPGEDLARTARCPDAVNRRTVFAGVLAGAAVGAVAAGEVLDARRRREATAPAPRIRAAPTAQLRRWGTAVAVLGAAVSLGGTVALVLLLADPTATLYLYVRRPVVAAGGLVALAPAIALLVAGRALVLVADALESSRGTP